MFLFLQDLDFVKQEQKEHPSLLIETIITMYRNIFLKKSFLLYKVYVKIKILKIQKSDKGNSAVVVDKADYLNKMENLLNDTRKFEKTNLKNAGILKFAIIQEKPVDNILKN